MPRRFIGLVFLVLVTLALGTIVGERLSEKEIKLDKKIETRQDLVEWYCDLHLKPKPKFCEERDPLADCPTIIAEFCGDAGVEYFVVTPSIIPQGE